VAHRVAFVLIGGAAIQSHGRPFDTQDVDVAPDADDATLRGSPLRSTGSTAASSPTRPKDQAYLRQADADRRE
jgi:hypothetical protein